MPLVLGVVSSAAATRVEVRDADDGTLVARGSARHRVVDHRQQPAQAWWDGLVDAIADAGIGREVAALAVAAQRQALVLVDGAGAPIGPASLRTDDRAGPVARQLTEGLGAARLAKATGHVPGPDTPLARLARQLRDDRALAERVAGVLAAGDVLTARLTGRFVTDRSNASGTGWWDPLAGRWRTDLLERAVRPLPRRQWPDVLPAVLRPAETADRVSATVHELVGLRSRPLVTAGLSDLAARVLATGAPPGAAVALLDDDDPAVVAITPSPIVDESGRIVSLADACGGHIPTIGIAPVGRALATTARLLGTDPAGLARVAAHAAADGPAGRRLVALAERPWPPVARTAARPGAVLGLDGATTAADLARAALLGVAAEVVGAVAALGPPVGDPLVLAGAVARWPGVAAAVADVAGRPVVVAGGDPAVGACVDAAAALRGAAPGEVAAAWSAAAGGDREVVEPSGELDGEAFSRAYDDARRRLVAPADRRRRRPDTSE